MTLVPRDLLAADCAETTLRGLADATKLDAPFGDLVRYTVAAGRPGLQPA